MSENVNIKALHHTKMEGFLLLFAICYCFHIYSCKIRKNVI